MADYASFRQQLDSVLRTLDVKQVREFLVAEGQWEPGTPSDPEFAMWMATSPSELIYPGCLAKCIACESYSVG